MKLSQLFCFVMILGGVTVLAFPIEEGTIHADDQEKIHVHGVVEQPLSHETPKYADGNETRVPKADHHHVEIHVHEQPLVHKMSENNEGEFATTLNFSLDSASNAYYNAKEDGSNITATTTATENNKNPQLFCICGRFENQSSTGKDAPFISNVFCQPESVSSEADCHESCKKASVSRNDLGDHKLCSWTSDYSFVMVVHCVDVSGMMTQNETIRRFLHPRLDFGFE